MNVSSASQNHSTLLHSIQPTSLESSLSFIFLFGFTYSIPFLFIGTNDGRTCIPNAIISHNLFGEMYYYLTEIVTSVIPFVSLLIMNSVIIHTLRKRSKLAHFRINGGQGQNEGQNMKIKKSEKQVYTMLLLLTFVFLALSTPVTLLIFYINFYIWKYPLLLCKSSLVLPIWRKNPRY